MLRIASELHHRDRTYIPTATTVSDVTRFGLISPRGTRDGLLPVSPAFVCVPGGPALSRGGRRGERPHTARHGQCSYGVHQADPPSRLAGRRLPHEGQYFSRPRAPWLSQSRFQCHW